MCWRSGAHLEQQILEPVVLGGDHDRPRPRSPTAWSMSTIRPGAEQVLDVHEPPHVVEITFVHDDAAASRPMRLGGRHLDRDVGRHGDDVAARRHRIRTPSGRTARASGSAGHAPARRVEPWPADSSRSSNWSSAGEWAIARSSWGSTPKALTVTLAIQLSNRRIGRKIEQNRRNGRATRSDGILRVGDRPRLRCHFADDHVEEHHDRQAEGETDDVFARSTTTRTPCRVLLR